MRTFRDFQNSSLGSNLLLWVNVDALILVFLGGLNQTVQSAGATETAQ